MRAGKIKTPLGLYNDTQDQEFLHTWALLPQSVYPVDLRASTIAHVGGDIYGTVNIAGAGSLVYGAFAGSIPNDKFGGFLYGIQAMGGHVAGGASGRTAGVDLRWSSPTGGLMVGSSLVYNHRGFKGTLDSPFRTSRYSTTIDRVMVFVR